MWLVLLSLLIIVAPYVARAHYVRSAKRLQKAEGAWLSVERHARVLLEDRQLPSEMGNFIEWTLGRIGDGSLTRTFLRSLLLRKRASEETDQEFAAHFSALSKEQEQQFLRFMIASMFYDSLRTSVSGSVLRRLLYWLASTVGDRQAPVSQPQVKPIMRAAETLCHA